MKNFLKTFAPLLVIIFFSYFAGVGIREKFDQYFVESAPSISVVDNSNDAGWQLKEPSEYIEGPLVAATGELCVFHLSDSKTKADWVIVPPATCYIDSSGSSLAFASNVPSKYSIIAAIVEDGDAKILTHVCDYGVSPEPVPKPHPSPSPNPTPSPTPQPVSLGDWIKQNVPDAGKSQCSSLASCYEAAAEGIEKGSIRSTEAAFSVIRTATQTKIKPDIWGEFLDGLSTIIGTETDVKKLGMIFAEIANGLRLQTSGDRLQEKVFQIPVTTNSRSFPEARSLKSEVYQTQPTIIQSRRSK